MLSHHLLVAFGRWLFHRRSYLPVFFAVLFVPASSFFEYPRNHYCLQHTWEFFCLGITLSGFALRVLTVAYIREGSSDRSLNKPGGERLNTTGMYSLVRNPLYLGNGLIWCGIVSLLRLWWLTALIMLIFVVYYRLIIIAEEAYLSTKFGSVFFEWVDKTPALLPTFHGWKKPELPFSFVMVVRREYSGLFQIFLAYAIMNMLLRHTVEGLWQMDLFWQESLGIVSTLCLFVFWLLRRTNFLTAPPTPDESVTGGFSYDYPGNARPH